MNPSDPRFSDAALSGSGPPTRDDSSTDGSPGSVRDGFPLTRTGLWLVTLWGLFLVGGFGVAAWLEPESRGFGTHMQLGLPPCSFEPVFGLPCPSCGMTTSFSYFVRGQWLSALRANAAGLLLALSCAVQIP